MSLSITQYLRWEFRWKICIGCFLSGNTIANGLIEVKPNVKFKEVLKRVSLSGAIANASCDFTDAGAVVLTERIIEPKELQVNLEFVKLLSNQIGKLSQWDILHTIIYQQHFLITLSD